MGASRDPWTATAKKKRTNLILLTSYNLPQDLDPVPLSLFSLGRISDNAECEPSLV